MVVVLTTNVRAQNTVPDLNQNDPNITSHPNEMAARDFTRGKGFPVAKIAATPSMFSSF
jgi:hypothetical protein